MKSYLVGILFFCFLCQTSSQITFDSTFTRKSVWVPALEITGVNILVNRFDVYVLKAEWAKVSWDSWANNIKRGFDTDGDQFATNFFLHPYHGSLYYNSARSSGFSYWQSIPFAVGGSLMWEFFGETEPPSEIDINTTTLGGIYLGEMTHRLSKLLLRNDKRRGYKTLRHVGAFALNPMRQLNSWIFDDVENSFTTANQRDFPFRAQISAGFSIPIQEFDKIDALSRFNLNYFMFYGDLFEDREGFKPFDSFKLNAWLDIGGAKAEKRVLFGILSQAPLYKKLLNDNSAFTVSQHYNYIENQIFKLGAMAISADYSVRHHTDNVHFLATANVGFLPFASSSSEIVDHLNEEVGIEEYKEYVYGRGYLLKTEGVADFHKYGRLSLSYRHWYINTENYVQGIERTSLSQFKYLYPTSKKSKLGIQLFHYYRKSGYPEIAGFENINDRYSEARLLYTYTL